MLPSSGTPYGLNSDKLLHLIAFAGLSVNLTYKYFKTKHLAPVMMWAIIFALATEFFQQYIPGRAMDFYDGLADSLGIAAGYYLYVQFDQFFNTLIKKMGG